MTIFKKLPLMAFGLGLGFIFAMSSFKGETKQIRDSVYGLYTGPTIPGTGVIENTWYDFNAPPAGYKSECDVSTNICTRTAPNETSQPLDQGFFNLVEE